MTSVSADVRQATQWAASGSVRVAAGRSEDYASRLRHLRNCLRLSQADLAELVGAAGKAVVYQWESGKRVPSHIFWQRVLVVGRAAVASSARVPLRLDQGARSSVG